MIENYKISTSGFPPLSILLHFCFYYLSLLVVYIFYRLILFFKLNVKMVMSTNAIDISYVCIENISWRNTAYHFKIIKQVQS